MKIATVLIAHNVELWVAEAVTSVLRQTRPPEHLIVVENGSSDRTIEAIKKATAGHFAGRLTLLSEVALGAGGARNRGAEVALDNDADVIGFLDGDDWWQPRFLERLSCALQIDSSARASFGWPLIRSESGQLRGVRLRFKRTFNYDDLLWYKSPMLTGSNMMVRATAFGAIDGFDPSIKNGEDWEFLLRLVRSGGTIRCLPAFVVNYRRRFDSRSTEILAAVQGLKKIGEVHPGTRRAKHWWWPLNQAHEHGQAQLIHQIQQERPRVQPSDYLSFQFVKYARHFLRRA